MKAHQSGGPPAILRRRIPLVQGFAQRCPHCKRLVSARTTVVLAERYADHVSGCLRQQAEDEQARKQGTLL